MKSTPQSIPNAVRPVCPNSNKPESLLFETNCKEQISANAFHPFNLEILLSDTDSEIEERMCYISRKKNAKPDYANCYLVVNEITMEL